MIRLDRSGVKAPATWAAKVRRAFADADAFEAKAREFEQLDIDDPARRQGFRSFCLQVLPKVRGRQEFRALWGAAKDALRKMSHQKCSYCESMISHERTGAVEHYQPKALFPSLAYNWNNYFLGCGGCNGAKGDKWPLAGGTYVRPDEGDPMAHFQFFEDGRVEASGASPEAEQTIADFDLNERWVVECRRRAGAEMLADLRSLFRDAAIPAEAKRRLALSFFSRVCEPDRAYSAALRQCFEREWAAAFPGEPI